MTCSVEYNPKQDLYVILFLIKNSGSGGDVGKAADKAESYRQEDQVGHRVFRKNKFVIKMFVLIPTKCTQFFLCNFLFKVSVRMLLGSFVHIYVPYIYEKYL